jgi:hypothetical protein
MGGFELWKRRFSLVLPMEKMRMLYSPIELSSLTTDGYGISGRSLSRDGTIPLTPWFDNTMPCTPCSAANTASCRAPLV